MAADDMLTTMRVMCMFAPSHFSMAPKRDMLRTAHVHTSAPKSLVLKNNDLRAIDAAGLSSTGKPSGTTTNEWDVDLLLNRRHG